MHEKYKSGLIYEDYSAQYLEKIIKFLRMTMFDPKNSAKGYRFIELNDELEEIKKYIKDEVTADYILRYWDEFTKAIS